MSLHETTVKAIKGSFWSFSGQYLSKAFIFITSVVITYFLTPEQYGLANYAITASSIFLILSDLGLHSAIIYFDDNQENLNTGFWLLILNNLFLSLLAWFIAPLVGAYFSDPRVVPIFRAFSILYPINAIMVIHDAILQKKIDFQKKLIPDVAQQFAKSAASILFAIIGFGAFSMVSGTIVGGIIGAIVLWRINPWRPKWQFSKQTAKQLLAFGFSMLIIEFLAMIALQVDKWLIGRYLSVSIMGIYSVGIRIPEYIVKQISLSIATVSFPLFSTIRENKAELINTFQNSVYAMTLFSFPLGIGLFLVSEPLIKLIYPDNWLDVIPIIKIFSIQFVILSITYNVGNLLKANNYLKQFMSIIVYRIVIISSALITIFQYSKDIVVISLTILLISPIAYTLIDIIISKRLFQIKLEDFIKSIKIPTIAVLLMVIVEIPVLILTQDLSNILQIISITVIGAATYLFTLSKLAPNLYKLVKEKLLQK